MIGLLRGAKTFVEALTPKLLGVGLKAWALRELSERTQKPTTTTAMVTCEGAYNALCCVRLSDVCGVGGPKLQAHLRAPRGLVRHTFRVSQGCREGCQISLSPIFSALR